MNDFPTWATRHQYRLRVEVFRRWHDTGYLAWRAAERLGLLVGYAKIDNI